MNSLRDLQDYGQSAWLDYIQRSLLTSGQLKDLVEDGLKGLTSNPTIFRKAIGETTDYDGAIRAIVEREPQTNPKVLYERLAVEDIQTAADALLSVYKSSVGTDGFVSLEVSPHLANNTEETVDEATRLWEAVSRSNLMIKVPATPGGVVAIEALIGRGINVNSTLMFSLRHYETVAHAYIRGVKLHPNPTEVASVASFFVSRVDAVVDEVLQRIGSEDALRLCGKIAIANTKRVYRRFQEIFHGETFREQKERGAHIQRPLWGSTSTKNPAYADLLYVEELIGPDTVNTMPPTTLNAFRDHGRVRKTLTSGLEEAEEYLATLETLGVDLSAITEQLQRDGVVLFTESYEQLLSALGEKRKRFLGN